MVSYGTQRVLSDTGLFKYFSVSRSSGERTRRRRVPALFRYGLRPGVLQADGTVEDGLAGLGVLGVGAEVAGAFELHARARREGEQGGFDEATDGLERAGIEERAPVGAFGDIVQVLVREEAVVT